VGVWVCASLATDLRLPQVGKKWKINVSRSLVVTLWRTAARLKPLRRRAPKKKSTSACAREKCRRVEVHSLASIDITFSQAQKGQMLGYEAFSLPHEEKQEARGNVSEQSDTTNGKTHGCVTLRRSLRPAANERYASSFRPSLCASVTTWWQAGGRGEWRTTGKDRVHML